MRAPQKGETMKTLRNSVLAAAVVIVFQFLVMGVFFTWLRDAPISARLDRIVPGAGSIYTNAVEQIAPSGDVIYASRTISPDFRSNLVLTADGEHIIAKGHVGCTAGEEYIIRATITQASTGAVAEGQTQAECTGDKQRWKARTDVLAPNEFVLGPVLACGLIRTHKGNSYTDAWQWCETVTLIKPK